MMQGYGPLLKTVTIGALLLVAIDSLVFRTGLYFKYIEPASNTGTVMTALASFDTQYRPGATNVLMLGDSRIGEGFSASVANQAASSTGVNFIGLSMPGSVPRIWDYFLRRLDLQSKPIAGVVLMTTSVSAGDDVEDQNNRILDIQHALPLVRIAEFPEFVLSFNDEKARRRALQSLLLPARGMQADLHAFLMSPYARIQKLRAWKTAYIDPHPDYPGRPELVRNIPPEEIATMTVPRGVSPPTPMHEYLRNTREPRDPQVTASMTRYRHVWYGQIADLLVKHSARLIVYQIPRGPFHRQLKGNHPPDGPLLGLEQQGKLILLDSEPFVELEQPQYFFDHLHLNRPGRLAFSKLIAKMVPPLFQ
jgi:hypothetical protein